MLFKRFIVLAVCILLFIGIYIGYFAYEHGQTESRFTEERVKFGVENTVLTAADSAPVAPTTLAAPDSSAAPAPTAPPPGSSPANNPTPAPDTNLIIGPIPPSSSTPDTAPAPAATPSTPAPPDSNSAPMAPSSTRNDPREQGSPFLILAAYHPSGGMMIETPGFAPSLNSAISAPAPPVTSPSTNADAANAGATNTGAASVPATNSAPETNAASSSGAPDTARPVPVEASVIVLLYHQFVAPGVHVAPKFQWTMNEDVFEAEMKYIHDNGYHVIPMSDLLKFLKHEIGLPPNSVVITIDDGYKSAIVYAAPILKKYGYPWTFFIYPQFITVNESAGAASWNDLLALQADGVDIESHSMTHPQLNKKGGKSPEQYDAWLTNETAGAKALLEQKMGKPITCFAYPYGAYNKEVEAKAIAAGYEAIFTVADNPVHATTDLHSIGRYTITHPVEKNFAAYLRQGALGIAEANPAPGATISDPRPVITAVLGYAGNLDPNSIETEVRDYGSVKHDYDPKTSTLRLYLPRDLVQPVNLVNIRVKDAQTGQIMVANWHFNYEPAGAGAIHPPIEPATNSASASTNAPAASSPPTTSSATNAAPATNAPASTHVEAAVKSAISSSSPLSSKSH